METLKRRGHRNARVQIVTLAVGTEGYLPDDTRYGLGLLLGKKTPALKKICIDLMIISHRLAIQVYGAWKAEQAAHDTATALRAGQGH